MRHIVRPSLFLSLLMALLLMPAARIGAQEALPPHTLTLTEAAINEALAVGIEDPNTAFFVDLQPGQMVINLNVTGQRGNVTRFALTVVPVIDANGQLTLEATLLTVNDFPIDLGDNEAIASSADAVGELLQAPTDGAVQSIVINQDSLTIAFENTNPDDPIISIVDSLFSLTYLETAVNNQVWVTDPTDPTVTNITVDLQPGQAVIDVARSVEPVRVVYVVIPTVVENTVSWQVNVQGSAETTVATTLSTVWRAYFGGIYSDSSLIDTQINDMAITFTWDLENIGQDPGEPIVTYTINEAEINAALAPYATGDLTALSVDIQPNRLLMFAAGVDESGLEYTATLALVPVLEGGDILWAFESLDINGFVVESAGLDGDDSVTDAITQGLGGHTPNATVTDFEMTDTQMTIIVRYD